MQQIRRQKLNRLLYDKICTNKNEMRDVHKMCKAVTWKLQDHLLKLKKKEMYEMPERSDIRCVHFSTTINIQSDFLR